MKQRLSDSDYYEKNKWDQKERTKELKSFEKKASAKQFLEDLGEKEMGKKFFNENEVYNMSLPVDTEDMINNLE
jgi:hypothetical protein